MNLIIFIVGFILGLEALRIVELLKKIKDKIEEALLEIERNQGNEVQFIDPITPEQRFEMAERVDDLLNK